MIRISSGILALMLAATPAPAQNNFSSVEISVIDVADGIFMLRGAGGNIGLSTGADGAFVIDDQFAPLSDKIIAAIRSKTDGDISFVLNTHYHGDHTGGNAAFGLAGARIIAHSNVRERLKEELAGPKGRQLSSAAATAALPVITFSDQITFFWNGQEIHFFHPVSAHTDGDGIVHFRDANVVHMGDVFFNGMYPYIDLDGGGDLDGYIAAQEAALAMIGEDTRIIPGHGALATKADLQRTTDMLKQVRMRIQALIDAGLDEEAVVAADAFADLDGEWGKGFINPERMARTAYKALTRAAATTQ